MKFTKILLPIVLIIPLFANSQHNPLNDKMDAMIKQGMKDWYVPGLSAIIMKDGEIVFQKSYGVRDVETGEAVDENTLFSMASTTKAIVCLSLGILVDRDKLNWDDKVVDHVPSFKLSDPYLTANARVIDLLTHNMGPENISLAWIIDSVSTQETISRLAHADIEYPVRGGFAYQNVMYAVAGEVIESITGESWNTFVAENIFQPLEMKRSVALAKSVLKSGNYASPHVNDEERGVIKVGQTFSDQIGPAGMIWSCTRDIGNYLTYLLNDGVYKGKRLVTPETFEYLFQAHAILSEEDYYPTHTLTNPHWETYGLGWFQNDYRNRKVDFHTGSLPGLVAIVGLMHDEDVAVYVFANMDHAELRHAIMYKAFDLYVFEDDSRDWHKEVFDLYSSIIKESSRYKEDRKEARVKNTSTTLPLPRYAGTYKNDLLGTVRINTIGNQIYISFNDILNYKMEHWHYDTFQTEKDLKWQFRLLVNFNLNNVGNIESLEVFGEEFLRGK